MYYPMKKKSPINNFLIVLLTSLLILGLSYYFIIQNQQSNSKSNELTKFCGGFARSICPEGFSCKLDGKYPDASGKCVKK